MPSRYDKVLKHADSLHRALSDILRNDLNLKAELSYRVCEEIMIHHLRDMDRLYAVHHDLVHPTKHCSYLAFWIRKLKPVAKAYPLKIVGGLADGANPPLENEDTEVNEKLSILVALRHAYIADDLVGLPNKTTTTEYLGLYEHVIVDFFNETGAEFDYLGSRVKSLVYDMRFRTFGPHHLTHILVTLVRELAKA